MLQNVTKCYMVGGGILVFAILYSQANAIELNEICASTTDKCKITTNYDTITNHAKFTAPQDEGVYIEARIGTFINYGDIIEMRGNQAFKFEINGYIASFINYGNISKNGNMSFWGSGKGISNLTNYGTMGAIDYSGGSATMTLNNFGVIKARSGNVWHINAKNNILIANYALNINESATTFNKFSGSSSLSHLVISGSGVSFKDGKSKIILDFGSGFEFDKGYLFSKLVTNTSGNNKLIVDLSHLTTKTSLYRLTQSGENFIVSLDAPNSEMGILYKSNIRTMNNFWNLSNSMIYPRKHNLVILRE